jgi:peptidyl-prolyl cis-trans isomerase C
MRASSLLALGVGLFVSALQARPVHADVSLAETTVVAKVGSRSITADELNRRMAAIQPFLLRDYGQNAEDLRRNFLEKVLIREALLAQGAADAKLDQRDDVKDRITAALRSAMLAKVREEVLKNEPVTDAEIKQYYEANITKFRTPPRVGIARILVATREQAEAVIKDLENNLSAARWDAVARDKSLDKVSAMRGGNFGYVSPDGATDDPGIVLDRAIVKAAEGVESGKLVPQPVQEGDRWAVVWHRGNVSAVERTLENEQVSIRSILTRVKVEKRTAELLARLRKETHHESDFEALDSVDLGPSGKLHPARRPGVLSPQKPSASPKPMGPHGSPFR